MQQAHEERRGHEDVLHHQALTGLIGLLDGLGQEELLEVGLAVEGGLVALVAVDAELLAALHAPEAVLVPDQALGLGLLHLEDDLAAAAAVRVGVAVLGDLRTQEHWSRSRIRKQACVRCMELFGDMARVSGMGTLFLRFNSGVDIIDAHLQPV